MKPYQITLLTGAVLAGGVLIGFFARQPANTAILAAQAATPPATTPLAKPMETKVDSKPGERTSVAPPDSDIPDNDYGAMIKLGENIFNDPQHYASEFVGNSLKCSNCHMDRGRLDSAAPLRVAYTAYPAYRAKTKQVNSFAERLQGCFQYSMNGKAPPLGGKTLTALESYAFFLAKGARVGEEKHGYVAVKDPAEPPDYARGQQVFESKCAMCHGMDGQGQISSEGEVMFPPLWGQNSYNWGAGMAQLQNAAAFIKSNMPYSQGSSLTDQQTWDVSMFIDSHERPQDPRFINSVEETRKAFQNTPMSMYGKVVNGQMLGANSPPAGFMLNKTQ